MRQVLEVQKQKWGISSEPIRFLQINIIWIQPEKIYDNTKQKPNECHKGMKYARVSKNSDKQINILINHKWWLACNHCTVPPGKELNWWPHSVHTYTMFS